MCLSCVYASPLVVQYFNGSWQMVMRPVLCLNVLTSIRNLQTKQNLFWLIVSFPARQIPTLWVGGLDLAMRPNNQPEFLTALLTSCDITLGGYRGKTLITMWALNLTLLPSLATPPSSTFELHHHDSDVVGAAAVKRLQDDAFGAEVRLVQALANEPDGLLVAESIPQAIGRQDHELWLEFVQVKGHDIRVRDDYVEVLQWVVPQRAGHSQDSLHSPGSIKTDETSWNRRKNTCWWKFVDNNSNQGLKYWNNLWNMNRFEVTWSTNLTIL